MRTAVHVPYPETFADAQRIRVDLIQYFSQALLETDPPRLAMLVEEVRARLELLPAIRIHFDVELRRLMMEPPPPIVIDGSTWEFVPEAARHDVVGAIRTIQVKPARPTRVAAKKDAT